MPLIYINYISFVPFAFKIQTSIFPTFFATQNNVLRESFIHYHTYILKQEKKKIPNLKTIIHNCYARPCRVWIYFMSFRFAKLLNSKHRVLDLTWDFQYITATYKVRSQGDWSTVLGLFKFVHLDDLKYLNDL